MIFFVKVGIGSFYLGEIERVIIEVMRRVIFEILLRFNVVDVFIGRNLGDNMGKGVLVICWELVEGSDVEIVVFFKGGGSENCFVLVMLILV